MSLYHCNYIIYYQSLSQLTTHEPVCYFSATHPPNHPHLSPLKCQQYKISGQNNWTKRPHRHRMWMVFPSLYNGPPLSHPQNCPFPWGI